jgi:hypothetical protein
MNFFWKNLFHLEVVLVFRAACHDRKSTGFSQANRTSTGPPFGALAK